MDGKKVTKDKEIDVGGPYHGSVCWRMELACDSRVRFERRALDERD